MVSSRADLPQQLRLGRIRDFVVVTYTNRNIEGLRKRVRRATLEGEFMFVRIQQYEHTPVREHNLWVAPANPAYRRAMTVIPIHDLCWYLHEVPERSGRRGYVNLIRVAKVFVNV